MDESRSHLTPELGWSNRYVSPPVEFVDGGRDTAGWDCWGLIRWVYEHELGVLLPDYCDDYESVTDSAGLLAVFEAERQAWRQVETPRAFDVAWIAIAGRECHVGLIVDARTMLHVFERVGTRIERIESPLWQRRIRGFYRHRTMR